MLGGGLSPNDLPENHRRRQRLPNGGERAQGARPSALRQPNVRPKCACATRRFRRSPLFLGHRVRRRHAPPPASANANTTHTRLQDRPQPPPLWPASRPDLRPQVRVGSAPPPRCDLQDTSRDVRRKRRAILGSDRRSATPQPNAPKAPQGLDLYVKPRARAGSVLTDPGPPHVLPAATPRASAVAARRG